MLTIDKKNISLTVGVWEKLSTNTPAVWASNNPNVFVDGNGWVLCIKDAIKQDTPNGQATITATVDGDTVICDVTIVPWKSNRKALSMEMLPVYYRSMMIENDVIYGMSQVDGHLYKTENQFETVSKISHLSLWTVKAPMLATPFGYFLHTFDGKVYYSADKITWRLEISGLKNAVMHSLDWWQEGLKGYVFIAEFSNETNHRHRIFRGTYEGGIGTWENVLQFNSMDEATGEYARHFHIVKLDQATGDVYAMTGDANPECRILVSKDKGNTWRILGTGSQDWRPLAIWFTDKYMYWNMDSPNPQSIWRIARSNIPNQSPQNDLKEKVMSLNSGAHWHICPVKHQGEDYFLMSTSAEGAQRDWLSRVFLLKELSNGELYIEEIFSSVSNTPDAYDTHAAFHPFFQDNGGKIYFHTTRAGYPGENSSWKSQIVDVTKLSRKTWRNSVTFK